MQLHEVHGVDAEVLARALEPAAKVLVGVETGIERRPPPELGRDDEPFCSLTEKAPDQALRAPVPVDVGGVEERDPGIDRGMQRGKRLLLVGLAPGAADRPRAETDLGDVPAGLSEPSRLHARNPISRGRALSGSPSMATGKALGQHEVWLLTGSQELYGDASLRQVEEHAREVAAALDAQTAIPVRVVHRARSSTTPESIRQVCLEANASERASAWSRGCTRSRPRRCGSPASPPCRSRSCTCTRSSTAICRGRRSTWTS